MNIPALRVVFDRKKIASKEKKGLIQIEVTFERKRKWISTGVKVYSDQFNEKVMVYGRSDAFVLNEQINRLIIDLRAWINELYKKESGFSFDKLDNYIAQSQEGDSFLLFMEKRIEERQDISEGTKFKHRAIIPVLAEFGMIQTFSDISLKNIVLFDEFIRRRAYMQSTIYDYHKRLKAYINEAIRMELVEKNPYISFHVDKGDYENLKYLTIEELARVESVQINDTSIGRVRDCFIFQCYTGLAYADFVKFDFENDVIETEGKYYIEDKRQKTGTPYKLRILTPAMNILKKYDCKLPVISNQQYNLRLKVVAQLSSIKKNLTTHVARHTFATWVLSKGVEIETVSKMLAHSNISTTQVYAKVLQKSVDDAFDKLEDLF